MRDEGGAGAPIELQTILNEYSKIRMGTLGT